MNCFKIGKDYMFDISNLYNELWLPQNGGRGTIASIVVLHHFRQLVGIHHSRNS